MRFCPYTSYGFFVLIGIWDGFHRNVDCTDEYVANVNSCYVGSYRSTVGPYNQCAGYVHCEKGYYCSLDNIKRPCPSGRYGNIVGLYNESCSGSCPEGYYCPQATVDPYTHRCGSATVYCPKGSSVPLTIPEGYYGVGYDEKTFSERQICPLGFYCQKGIKHICPPGYFGSSPGLTSQKCSGECPAGWYCPANTSTPIPCQNDPKTFCPKGTSNPISTTPGYYAVDSQIRLFGGFTSQEPCPIGTYCFAGIKYSCPPGRYGNIRLSENNSCSGLCEPGWYCPAGSSDKKQVPCGASDVYCPSGSAHPLKVSRGYFTYGSNLDIDYNRSLTEINFKFLSQIGQTICEPGHYCLEDGISRLCPAGRFGSTHGLSSPTCSGDCEQGYFCPEGSTSARQFQCGAKKYYCPSGSKAPLPVSHGYYTLGSGIATRYTERKCEPGFYCHDGAKYLCPEGTYGDLFGETRTECNGICQAGYYCPEGSKSPTEVECGEPSRYCPEGSSNPIDVSIGYYTTGGNTSTRTSQAIAPRGKYALNGLLYSCPAGRYGVKIGEINPSCTGSCHRGYYCPAGSISPFMHLCGADDLICPPGSAAPIQVHRGYYTTNQWEEGCKPGTWRNFSLAIDPSLPGSSFLPTETTVPPCELCPEGTYKVTRGDELSSCLPCPEYDSISSSDRTICQCQRVDGGRPYDLSSEFLYFNISSGSCQAIPYEEAPFIVEGIGWSMNTSVNRFQEFQCEPGHYCVDGVQYPCLAGRYGERTMETNPQCTGKCPAGYYCALGSSYPYEHPCGGSNLYCPEGSVNPLIVPPGYYSTGSNSSYTRYSITICPKGQYCQEGIPHDCSPGRYTDVEGTIDSLCKDVCEPGYYCTGGSSSARQFECGSPTLYCPRGSFEPKPVHNGFYCGLTGISQGADSFWNDKFTTCSVELPCEPGSYCVDGLRRLCPPGRFGWRYGLNNSDCSGQCAPGYYCPSYLEPQPQAPPYTVWPRTSQLTAYAYKCGSVGYFCPKGASYPQKVRGGYYSIGGDPDLMTRRGESQCPTGHYCIDGILNPCARGRYGELTGSSSPDCSGFCPAGFYCPEGTSQPISCPPFTYSVGGAWECSDCPGKEALKEPLRCQHSKECCFMGL